MIGWNDATETRTFWVGELGIDGIDEDASLPLRA